LVRFLRAKGRGGSFLSQLGRTLGGGGGGKKKDLVEDTMRLEGDKGKRGGGGENVTPFF